MTEEEHVDPNADLSCEDIDSEHEMFSSLLYSDSSEDEEDAANGGEPDPDIELKFKAVFQNFVNSLVGLKQCYTENRADLIERRRELQEKLSLIDERLKQNEAKIKALKEAQMDKI